MTTGELIRLLSYYCPDTDISIVGPNGEHSIGHLVSQDDFDLLDAEVALTILEG